MVLMMMPLLMQAQIIPQPSSFDAGKGKPLCLSSTNDAINTAITQVDTSLNDNPEHYQLTISSKGINIKGATEEAVFDGIQTLRQWTITHSKEKKGKIEIDPVTIDDSPRYCYRALLLDPARHFLSIKDIERYIDEMVKYKFNVLQLHLTDDQGWRVEIKSHPELTVNRQHYTQEELHQLIDYAAERYVQIVPELDIPGHTYGLLTNHQEFLCENVDTTGWGRTLRTDVMLCASCQEVYPLVKDVLKEICELFPSPYIHLGGDESLIEKNWGKCTSCQQLKESLHFTDNAQLMGYFFSHFWQLLRDNGKKPILWMEMDKIMPPANHYLFDYPKDVTLVSWRSGLTPKAIELAAKSGNNLLMAPGEHCYFDYPQYKGDLPETNNWGMPILTLQQAYEWDPAYPELGYDDFHIQGVMATLWGEAIEDVNRAFYMTYPRALALAEAGWSKPEAHNWQSFLQRLRPVLDDMLSRGIPHRAPFEAFATPITHNSQPITHNP